jgi:hypothetical protein
LRQADLRRACETQVKSHLVHLREAFIESGGRPGAVASLVGASAPAFTALLRNVARLNGVLTSDRGEATRLGAQAARIPEQLVSDLLSLEHSSNITAVDSARLFPQYLAAGRASRACSRYLACVAALFRWASLLVLLVAATAVAQPETPELTRPVNDFANVIDPDSERQLESLIRALQETTGDVVVVATIDSLDGEDVYQYAERMFRNRGKGIGQAGKDNGLLVLAAVKDRQLKIEVGYDLEQFITDGFAGETIRQEIAPRFRQGAYGAGLLAGVQRIIGRIGEGRNVAIPGAPRAPERTSAHRVAAQVETSSF